MNAHDLDSVAVYALGSLPPAEAARVRAHLKECVECRTEYDALRPAVNAVAVSAEACSDEKNGLVVPSPLLKARLLKTVRAEAAQPAQRRQRSIVWPAYMVAAASLVFALWMSVTNVITQSELRQAQDQVGQLTTQIARSNRSLAAQKMMVADLMSHDSQHYAVNDGEVVRHGDRIYIAMHGMTMPPKGHVYQAWVMPSGAKTMTPSVTFMPDHSGVAVVFVPAHATGMSEIAVSIEPEGGSKAPTTKPEFVVNLES